MINIYTYAYITHNMLRISCWLIEQNMIINMTLKPRYTAIKNLGLEYLTTQIYVSNDIFIKYL